jgi:hypothetical protein
VSALLGGVIGLKHKSREEGRRTLALEDHRATLSRCEAKMPKRISTTIRARRSSVRSCDRGRPAKQMQTPVGD